MLPDSDITSLRTQWTVEPPASDLADRIIRHALAQPQRQPLLVRLRNALAQPSYPLAMRGMAFAACVMVAVIAFDGERSGTRTASDGTTTTYQKPLSQIADELLLSDYQYSY